MEQRHPLPGQTESRAETCSSQRIRATCCREGPSTHPRPHARHRSHRRLHPPAQAAPCSAAAAPASFFSGALASSSTAAKSQRSLKAPAGGRRPHLVSEEKSASSEPSPCSPLRFSSCGAPGSAFPPHCPKHPIAPFALQQDFDKSPGPSEHMTPARRSKFASFACRAACCPVLLSKDQKSPGGSRAHALGMVRSCRSTAQPHSPRGGRHNHSFSMAEGQLDISIQRLGRRPVSSQFWQMPFK